MDSPMQMEYRKQNGSYTVSSTGLSESWSDHCKANIVVPTINSTLSHIQPSWQGTPLSEHVGLFFS